MVLLKEPKGETNMTRKPNSPLGTVTKLNISLSHETFAKLEAYCRKNERPRSWVIEKALQAYLTKLEK
jgi:predicted DNA-binding protein